MQVLYPRLSSISDVLGQLSDATDVVLIIRVFCVCMSVISEISGQEVVAPRCLYQRGELRLASYSDCFLS